MTTDYKPRRAKQTPADELDEYANKLDAHADRADKLGWHHHSDRDRVIANELREMAGRWES